MIHALEPPLSCWLLLLQASSVTPWPSALALDQPALPEAKAVGSRPPAELIKRGFFVRVLLALPPELVESLFVLLVPRWGFRCGSELD